MSAQLEIQIIACVVAAACALPGVFLVLRRMAMMSDAISHSILPGIVLAFFVTADLNSPFLLLAAALAGLVTVVLVELLQRSGLVREDAAIGLVFPILFSVGVILIARYAGSVHLDMDVVLLGELAFAPFDRVLIGGVDLGPRALWTMAAILLLNVAFITLFYKELKLATFDAGLAAALGFAPGLLHYSLMALVSLTAVGAFDAVGSILVVALMIAPPAAAYLLTDHFNRMVVYSVLLGVLGALSGYWLAARLDASIAGAMAVMCGVLFAVAFLMAPERGLLAIVVRRHRQRRLFAQQMLTIHLLHHEGAADATDESRVDHLRDHLRWSPTFSAAVIGRAERRGLLVQHDGHLRLTESGRQSAIDALTR